MTTTKVKNNAGTTALIPPPAGEESELAVLLHNAVASSEFTQAELARLLGYKSPNMVSMLKAGVVKLPLDRVPHTAQVLKLDPSHLFRLALLQYTEGVDVLAKVNLRTISDNEVEILNHIRKISKNSDPKATPDVLKALTAAFKAKP